MYIIFYRYIYVYITYVTYIDVGISFILYRAQGSENVMVCHSWCQNDTSVYDLVAPHYRSFSYLSCVFCVLGVIAPSGDRARVQVLRGGKVRGACSNPISNYFKLSNIHRHTCTQSNLPAPVRRRRRISLTHRLGVHRSLRLCIMLNETFRESFRQVRACNASLSCPAGLGPQLRAREPSGMPPLPMPPPC
jgi:hypothetical protein